MAETDQKTPNHKSRALLQLALLIAIIALANIVASSVYKRIDLTREKRFTLTDATINMLRKLDDVAYVKVYLEGELNADFKHLRNATQEMLNEFRAYASGGLEYEFIDPDAEPDDAERSAIANELMKKGLEPTRLIDNSDGYSEKIIFPGALLVYKGRELPVQLLLEQRDKGPQETLNNSIALLEYQFANALQKLQRPSKPVIAFLEGHGELGGDNVADIAASLSKYYVLERLNLRETLYIPSRVSVAVIAKPMQRFEEPDKYKLDQYIMGGGRVLWLVENMAASLDSMRREGGAFIALNYGLNLEDMLFKYGLRVDFDMVQDLQCVPIPVGVDFDKFGNIKKTNLYPWPYSPVYTMHNNEHPVTKNLDAVLGRFSGTIDTLKQKNSTVKKTVLLTTSEYSRNVGAPIKISISDVLRNQPDQGEYNKGFQPVAVALEGEFPSVFKNRLAASTLQMVDTLEDLKFKEQSPPSRMVVVSDGDIISNDFDRATNRPMPLGYYKYTKQTFANKEFVLNAIEWLTDENGIIEARSKDVKLRLLDEQRIKNEKLRWQLLNLLLPLALVLAFGLVYTLLRRRLYTH